VTIRRYRVRHETRYRYDSEVSLAHNRAVLVPRPLPRQRLLRAVLCTDPDPGYREDTTDLFGNTVTSFSIERPHRELSVVSDVEVELCDDVGRIRDETAAHGDATGDGTWEEAAARAGRETGIERLFCLESPYAATGDGVAGYAAASFPPGRPLTEAVIDLTGRIHRDFTYRPGSTTIGTPVEELVRRRTGVCQDFAHVGLACLRAMGLAARYVSGYLETRPAPGQPRLVGADASHAWCAVRRADGTWLDLDPTNDLVGPTTHVTVGWGRDYGDVAPLAGVIFAGRVGSTLSVSVDVERLGS
jgi:transglutaminase-like putative cysteine protease